MPYPTRLTRRSFVKAAAASTAGLWVASHGRIRWAEAATGWSPYAEDPPTFPDGVASGDPLDDAVVLWTRVAASHPAVVRWEVAADAAFPVGSVVASGRVRTDARRDHTVKVDVAGLQPATTYYYRFRAMGATSRVGRTRTAAAGATPSVAFALASCQNFTDGFYAAWRHIAARDDLDFVLHVGDYIYEGGGEGVRAHEPPREVLTLDDYRARYASYRSDPDLRAAHAAHPFVVTPDDHEVANNSWAGGAENHQDDGASGEELALDYRDRRAHAFQAYDEWLPLRLPAGRDGADMRVHRRLAFGDLVDLLVLDSRQFRAQETDNPLPVPAPQTNPDNADPDRAYLGAAQKAWLREELVASRARWRILGNQAMLAQFTYGIWPDEVSTAIGGLIGMPPDGYTVNGDQWDGYQAEQRELLAFLRDEQVANVVVCTGDIHMSFANEVYVDEGRFGIDAPVAAEFVGPSISSTNFDESISAPPRTASLAFEQAVKASNPHIRWVEMDSNGYVVVRASADEMVGEWYHLSDVADPAASERLATAWRVTDGDLRLEWVGGDLVST
jgi:alkaline phosphatase D